MSDLNNDNSNSTKPKYCSTREVSNGTAKRPLYITIGPPCAGKTTFLQTSISENMIDITIDDQEGVYVPIHTKYFLVDQATPNDMDYLRKRMLYNLSLEQRIYGSDNDEMRKLLQYLSSPEKYHNNNQGGILQFLTEQPNYSEMQSKWDYLQKKQQQQDSNTIPPAKNDTWAEVLDRVLNEFIDIPLPETVDLFVLDGIFKTAPRDNTKSKLRRPSGLNAAFSQLKRVAHTQSQSPIAWGNTNTKPRDYTTALEIGESSQRPVYFIVYHNNNDNNSTTNCKSSYTLPLLPVEELFRRNIKRMLTTGRYIPCRAILDACVRVDDLVQKAVLSNPLFLDVALAQMAGYHLDTSNRTVSKISTKNNKNTNPSSFQRRYSPKKRLKRQNMNNDSLTDI